VVFSLPNSDDFEFIIEYSLACKVNSSYFVFHPFEISATYPEVKIHADFRISSSLLNEDFISKINQLPDGKKGKSKHEISPISKENYLKALNKGIDELKDEKINKFIYSRIKTIENTSDLDLSNYLIRLNKKHKTAFNYLFKHEKTGIWMGASPETLMQWKGHKISTMALAGTQPNLGNLPTWTSKEIEEQAYVTNYIQNTFNDNNIPVKLSETESVLAGPVYHLKTSITTKNNVTYTEALNVAKSLHPTPAICGVPLKAAQQYISEIEIHDRAYYTGFLGLVTPEKEINFFVNLRCLQVLPNQLALYLGGGITAKSIAESEWEETNFKAQTLLGEI
jgi:isochorismate synthase